MAAVLLLGVAASVQAQMQMPKPSPELKKLDFMTGTWKMDANIKPGPMGPGGPMTSTSENSWMDGGFFLTSHSKFESGAMGNGSGTAFMGYDPASKMYTYDEFNSMGEATHSTGKVEGDTWTWVGDDKMCGPTCKGRFVMKVTSPTAYTFTYDISPDGNTWTTVMDGKSSKVK